MPMFPLGTVLLPDAVLPLRIFEPRYRTMLDDCLAADRRFGVVLIERGSEVGGGDVRTDVGTMAEVIRAEPTPEGPWAVTAVGRARLRVDGWEDDDPYPRAHVAIEGDGAPPRHEDLVTVLAALDELRRVLDRSGLPGPGDTGPLDELTSEEARHRFVYWAVTTAQPGPLDAQRVLAAPDGPRRAEVAAEVIADRAELLRLGLAGS